MISQIPTLRTHIWQVRSGHIYPNPPWWFHRFLLWEFIFGRPGLGRSTPSLSVSNDNFTDSYSESSSLAGQIFLDLPLSPTGISQIPTLRAHIWQTRSWQILQPSPYSDFTNSYSDSLYLADQVLRSWQIYPLKWQFHRSLIWGLIFGRPGLGRSSILPPNNDFTDSYSESSYLADQVVGDLSSQMAMSKIATLRTHIWETRS